MKLLKICPSFISQKMQSFLIRLHLTYLRKRVWHLSPGCRVKLNNFIIQITDGPNCYIQYKDIFIRKIYHFSATCKRPLIIDGGSNIGLSVLYFKSIYPNAKIIAFEPDPNVFKILCANLDRNNMKGVTSINAGLGAQKGTISFLSDRSSGGHIGQGEAAIEIYQECLSSYLNEQIDFLKLNIEGSELAVLEEIEKSGKLNNIKEIVLEYHGWSDKKQQLGDILKLLDRNGYRYLVHDFDSSTCITSKPPFRITSSTKWFCLVYAKRSEN
jgi:FkbM family methyltransferase